MGKIPYGKTNKFKHHTNIKKSYDNEISEIQVKQRIELIKQYMSSENFYVVGMGGCSKQQHIELGKLNGVELLWTGSLLPSPLNFFSCVIGSHSGLYQLSSHDSLDTLFMSLIDGSMAGIYFTSNQAAQDFCSEVIRTRGSGPIDFSIYQNPEYFFYIVDGDNYESSLGLYEVISIGKDSKLLKSGL